MSDASSGPTAAEISEALEHDAEFQKLAEGWCAVLLSDRELPTGSPTEYVERMLERRKADVEGVALAAKRLPEGSVLSEGDTE